MADAATLFPRGRPRTGPHAFAARRRRDRLPPPLPPPPLLLLLPLLLQPCAAPQQLQRWTRKICRVPAQQLADDGVRAARVPPVAVVRVADPRCGRRFGGAGRAARLPGQLPARRLRRNGIVDGVPPGTYQTAEYNPETFRTTTHSARGASTCTGVARRSCRTTTGWCSRSASIPTSLPRPHGVRPPRPGAHRTKVQRGDVQLLRSPPAAASR